MDDNIKLHNYFALLLPNRKSRHMITVDIHMNGRVESYIDVDMISCWCGMGLGRVWENNSEAEEIRQYSKL